MILKQLLKAITFSVLLLCSIQFAFAQNKIVTGKVIDSKDGSVISNVSVIAKGTHIGTQTDINGNFRLTVPLSVKTLTILYVGFLSQNVDVSKAGNIEVALVAASSLLNDVVGIGYG